MCLTKPIADQSIYMRLVTVVQFVPRNGDTIKLTDDATGDSVQLELTDVVYDMAEGMFVSDITDERMIESYSEDGILCEQETTNWYKQFGFVRLNYPQGEGKA
ncbi:MAG: hypothetical protein V4649_19420 [Bacteroidota bacterium]